MNYWKGDKINSLLCVYNICGLSGKDNLSHYLHSLNSIVNQDLKHFAVVVSSCRGTDITRRAIQQSFPLVWYNEINDILTVDQTFNHTVYECIKRYGPFEGYLFIDSGVTLTDPGSLSKLYNLFSSGPYAMVAAQSNDDTGFGTVIDRNVFDKDYIIPLGQAFNLHCQIFSNELLEQYGRLLIDIFESFCTESTFSFLCAAINRYWVISKDVVVDHKKSVDGASCGFTHGHDRLFRANRTIIDLLNQPEAIESGVGYECWRGIKQYDPNKFNSGFAINDKLFHFMKDNFFLSKDQLDYEKIDHKFYD